MRVEHSRERPSGVNAWSTSRGSGLVCPASPSTSARRARGGGSGRTGVTCKEQREAGVGHVGVVLERARGFDEVACAGPWPAGPLAEPGRLARRLGAGARRGAGHGAMQEGDRRPARRSRCGWPHRRRRSASAVAGRWRGSRPRRGRAPGGCGGPIRRRRRSSCRGRAHGPHVGVAVVGDREVGVGPDVLVEPVRIRGGPTRLMRPRCPVPGSCGPGARQQVLQPGAGGRAQGVGTRATTGSRPGWG